MGWHSAVFKMYVVCFQRYVEAKTCRTAQETHLFIKQTLADLPIVKYSNKGDASSSLNATPGSTTVIFLISRMAPGGKSTPATSNLYPAYSGANIVGTRSPPLPRLDLPETMREGAGAKIGPAASSTEIGVCTATKMIRYTLCSRRHRRPCVAPSGSQIASHICG